MSEPAQEAEPPAVLQTEHLKSGGDHHLLLVVVQGRHALEGLEPLMGVLATLGLVGRHATHGAPEDVRVRAEVEGPTAGLDAAPLLEEVEVLELIAVEVAAHVDDALAPAAVGVREEPGGSDRDLILAIALLPLSRIGRFRFNVTNTLDVALSDPGSMHF